VLSHCLKVGYESARTAISRYCYLLDASLRFLACELNSKLTLLMLALESELRFQAPVTMCTRDLFEM
jgi:hypothetical protein